MEMFPSPCGVWVVSSYSDNRVRYIAVSVPLRGVGCFQWNGRMKTSRFVSVPLRGVGCFN